MFFDSPAHNIRLEILSLFSCKLSMIDENLQVNNINKVKRALSVYEQGMQFDGGNPVKFTFALSQEQRHILVQGDLENLIVSIKTMGFINESLYQHIHSYLINLSQQKKSIVRNFSPENIQRMQDECSQLVAAFRQGNVQAATVHFFNVGAMSGIT